MFDGSVLTALVDQTIGIPYLDGWVAAGEPHGNVSVRAVGTRQLHITAGNVPVVAALTVIRGPLTKSDILISRADMVRHICVAPSPHHCGVNVARY